jgi:hypothetical protein
VPRAAANNRLNGKSCASSLSPSHCRLRRLRSHRLRRRRPIARTAATASDERTALETEIARLQGENATLKKELLARGPPVAKPGEPELKLPSDADVDKVVSFLEKVWRRLIEMGRSVQKDIERQN